MEWFFCVTSFGQEFFFFFFTLSQNRIYFFPRPVSTQSQKIFCSPSGQQEAKLKTNNFWISAARQSECWLRSEKKRKKERKKERKGGERPQGKKRPAEGFGGQGLWRGEAASFDVGGLGPTCWDALWDISLTVSSKPPQVQRIITLSLTLPHRHKDPEAVYKHACTNQFIVAWHPGKGWMPFSELRELPQSFIKVSWSAFHTALNLIKATLTAL